MPSTTAEKFQNVDPARTRFHTGGWPIP